MLKVYGVMVRLSFIPLLVAPVVRSRICIAVMAKIGDGLSIPTGLRAERGWD